MTIKDKGFEKAEKQFLKNVDILVKDGYDRKTAIKILIEGLKKNWMKWYGHPYKE